MKILFKVQMKNKFATIFTWIKIECIQGLQV